jgi:hypothetical protein
MFKKTNTITAEMGLAYGWEPTMFMKKQVLSLFCGWGHNCKLTFKSVGRGFETKKGVGKLLQAGMLLDRNSLAGKSGLRCY